MEEWRVIEEFPDYEISNQGRVWSHKVGRVIIPGNVRGYLQVHLSNLNRVRHPLVHQLVAEAFLGEAFGLYVNHLDGNKSNNHVRNLEWTTRSQNMRHARDSSFMKSPGSLPRSVRVIETGEEFPSIKECARVIGGSKSGVSSCLQGRQRSHKGYRFEFV